MTSTTHPRQYKVTRRTPGSDWSTWAISYHPTIEAAEKAALRFFNGEGNYSAMKHTYNLHRYASRYAQSWVEIGRREGFEGSGKFRSSVHYVHVNRINYSDVMA